MKKLVLFDIDGTLLTCGPQVRPLFASALVEVFGTAGEVDGFDFTGRTDPGIVLDLITGAGLPEALVHERLPRMRSLYTERLDRELDRRGMVLLPGVVEILDRLTGRGDVTALLTGNWEPGARAKLSRFGLGRYFAFGAYGCDGVDRSELPPVALERAERATGRRFRPEEDVLIVGDSVHDVSCAHAHGIPCLAVGTGRTPETVLQAAGAEWVIGDLREAARAVPWLG